MADDELLPYINEHDSVVMATKEQFDRLYKPAGYRKLKANEPVPVQQSEVDHARAQGRDMPEGFEQIQPAQTPTPQSIRRLRMERENGAVGDADGAERETE